MKKLLSLAALLLAGMTTAMADDVKVTWQMGENTEGVADPATAAADIKYTVGSGLTQNSATAKCDDVVFTKFDQNTGSDKGNNGAKNHDANVSLGKYVDFTFTPQGGDFTPTKVSLDVIKIGTGDPNIFVDVIDGTGKTIAVATDVTIRKSSDASPSISHEFSVSGAESSNGAVTLRVIIGKLASGKAVGLANVVIEGTLVSSDAPVLNATSELNLKVSPLTPELTATATIALSGKNLTDGTYDTPVPADEAITIAPATFTVAGGEVSQVFTVTYKPVSSVTDGVTKVFFTIGDMMAGTTINYNARLEAYEQKEVSEETVWDWTKLTETVTLSEETVPSINDEFVFLDLEDQISFGTFDAQSIVISKAQYPVRSGKFQNGTIKFKTTVPGTVKVDFSDTGASGDNPVKRYLFVNGENTGFYTQRDGSSDRKETDEINVAKGEVVINAMQESTDEETGETAWADVPVQIFKITFVPGTADAISSVTTTAEAQQAIYSLSGQRVQNTQKGLYIQNGKKYIVK